MSNASQSPFDGPGPDAVFRERLEAGSFCIQHCTECGRHQFYPRVMCTECGASTLDWVEVSGRGTVYSTSVVRQRKEKGPDYNVAIIELAEGPRMMSRVEGIAPEEVTIGMAVAARIARIDDEAAVVFDAADARAAR